MEASLKVHTTRQIVLTLNEAEAKQLSDFLDVASKLDADAMCSTEYKEPPFEKFNDITFKLKMAFLQVKL